MKRFNDILLTGSGIILLFLTAMANVQVLYRYVLQLPLPWVEELIRYLMILIVMIASGVAVYQKSHLNVEVFDLILKKKQFQYLENGRLVFAILFSIAFAYLSFIFVQDTLKTGQVSPSLRIPMAVPLGTLLLGSLLMALNGIALLVQSNSRKSSEDRNEGQL